MFLFFPNYLSLELLRIEYDVIKLAVCEYIDILIHRLHRLQRHVLHCTLYSLIETFVSFNLLAYTCSGMYCMTPDQWWGLGLFCWIYIFLYLWSKTFLFLSEVKAIFSLSFSRPYNHTHTHTTTHSNTYLTHT